MKKIIIALVCLFIISGSVSAGIHQFTPNPSDMFDLDHGYYYGWGIDHDFGDGNITEVTLTIKNINNWDNNPNMLFINLLDQMDEGLYLGWDDYDIGAWGEIDNFYKDKGVSVAEWTDTDGGTSGNIETVTFNFSTLGLVDDFSAFAADGNFGFGFDPDCHFWNDGIELTVITDTPEPASMILFALGLAGGFARKKFKG